jgi:hypothetical protein
MPKKLEEKLKHEVETNPKYKHLSQERKNAIIYSVLRKTGWKPGEGSDIPSIKESLDQAESALESELLQNIYKELK